jgi:hypothetical protein
MRRSLIGHGLVGMLLAEGQSGFFAGNYFMVQGFGIWHLLIGPH